MNVRLAVVGLGLIGPRHVAAIRQARGAEMHSVTDPAPAGADYAAREDLTHFVSLDEALAARPDGVVLATPNNLHVQGALDCIAAGIPVLVEKPLATEIDGARAVVEAGEAAGVPVLTGHHRRHMPVIQAARERIVNGALGCTVCAHGVFWISKPDGYFDTPWRRQKGAGPVFMNLIHDIDLLRFLVGEITTVRAVETNMVRHHEIEDACAMILTFEGGAIGTFTVSDAIVSPWSWELTAHDNPSYPPTDQNAYFIGGTHGSIALPRGEEWSDGGKRDWWQPVSRTTLLRGNADPLTAQIENFAGVIRGTAEPVVSGREGLRSLAATLAVKRAAASGQTEVPEH